jgi:hypothetical protein
MMMIQLYLPVKRSNGLMEEISVTKPTEALSPTNVFTKGTARLTEWAIRMRQRNMRFSPCPKEKKRVGKQSRPRLRERRKHKQEIYARTSRTQ